MTFIILSFVLLCVFSFSAFSAFSAQARWMELNNHLNNRQDNRQDKETEEITSAFQQKK
jgi:hypothetical protein